MRLFDLKENYKAILDMIIEQEDEQVLIDTLASINDALEDKADAYTSIIKNLESDNHVIDEEIKRLKRRKASNDNAIKRMKESLQNAMEETGKLKFKTSLNTYNIQKNPPSLKIVDESLIPKDYWISQAPKLNKKEVLTHLKNGGEIAGVEVQQTKSLRVR